MISLQILDAQGNELIHENVFNNDISGIYTINLNKLTTGIYFVKFQSGEFKEIKKLIVNKY